MVEDGSAATVDKGRVTIAQVADLAGVSPTTVSHVLSGKRLVGAATKGTVQEAIRQLGYRPNNVARSLRTNRSKMVAVVVPDITNPFYAVLTRGLADGVDKAGYGAYVCNTDGMSERENTFLEDVLDRGVDGVVMASVDAADRSSTGPSAYGTPVVCVGGVFNHPQVDLVAADDEVGSHAATHHLIQRGAARIAMIQGPPESGIRPRRRVPTGADVGRTPVRPRPDGARRLDPQGRLAGHAPPDGPADAAGCGVLRERPDSHRCHRRRPRARAFDPGRDRPGGLRRRRRGHHREPAR